MQSAEDAGHRIRLTDLEADRILHGLINVNVPSEADAPTNYWDLGSSFLPPDLSAGDSAASSAPTLTSASEPLHQATGMPEGSANSSAGDCETAQQQGPSQRYDSEAKLAKNRDAQKRFKMNQKVINSI